MANLQTLLERFGRGDRLALARLLTLTARGEHVSEILAAVPASAPAAKIVAITGSAGVGKSTLIGKLIEPIRAQGNKVAVLACDPQSPLSGGALLGDRFRMPDRAEDEGVYIRSLAALSGHGAVADYLPLMTRLLGAFGFDVVLIETVGAGQGDVTVSELADVVVLLLQPETGDDLQWEKAGVLEVANVIVVQKADLPRAEQVAAQVRATLELSDRPPVPVVLVSARTGQGVAELWQEIAGVSSHDHPAPGAADQFFKLALEQLAVRFDALRKEKNPDLAPLIEKWQRGEITTGQAVDALLQLV